MTMLMATAQQWGVRSAGISHLVRDLCHLAHLVRESMSLKPPTVS